MEPDPRSPDFVSSLEAIEGRAMASLSAVRSVEALVDESKSPIATAMFSDNLFPLANRVVGLGLARPVTAEVVDQITGLYDTAGADAIFVPQAPTARPSTLPRMLRERGFVAEMKEAKLYRSTQDPPPMDRLDRVIEATDEDYETVLGLYRRGGMRPGWADVMANNLGTSGWHHYITFAEQTPVGIGSMYAEGGFATFFRGWTLADYKHQGYQRVLVSCRVAAALELGCQWIGANMTVEDEANPAEDLRSFTRLGFELLYIRTTHVRQRPGTAPPEGGRHRMRQTD